MKKLSTEKEIVEQLGEVIIHRSVRPNGTRRVALDFKNCPTMCEQHTAHLTDINYLVKTYAPDDLAMFLASRNQHRQEIKDHDFAVEPNLQEAKNHVYQITQVWESLDPSVKWRFKNPAEFAKFVSIERNAQLLMKNAILSETQVEAVQGTATPAPAQAGDSKPE